MKNSLKVTLLLFILLFSIVGCSGGDEEVGGEETAVPDLVQPTQPAAAVIADNALTAQAWQWVSFLDQAIGEAPIADPQNYTIDFLPDGTLQIKADCNNAGGSYTADGSNISIALGATTRVACAPESKGDQFLAYLSGAAKYSIANGRLQIELMADSGTMTFISINAIVPTAVPPTGGEPTAVPPSTTVPPTAVQATIAPPPAGTVVDGGSRNHATGSYAAPNYTVAAGDTLYSVSLRFNVLPAQIRSANGMTNNTIYTNQVLIIPSADTSATPIPPTAPPATTPERVTFSPNTVSASLGGSIDNGQPKQFVLAAMAGQTMQISTRSSAEYLMITVHDTNGNSMPITGINGQAENNVSMSLPYTGDYVIVITPATQPESPTMAFDITFTVQ